MKIYFFTPPSNATSIQDDRAFRLFVEDRFPDSWDTQPEHVEAWVQHLRDNALDMVTINPLILNLLSDEVAKEVIYLYNPTMGYRCFGSFPTLTRRLDALGPGEIICDTAIADLVYYTCC